jgi:hypothetical protein
MIFAVYDFYKYWFHKGIYSDIGLEKAGFVLASEGLLPILEKVKCGCVFVHRRNSFLSWLVMYYTGPGIISHCVNMFEGGILYDMTTQGGIRHHISDYFDGKTYIQLIDIPAQKSNIEKMKTSYEIIIPGSKFAWKKVFLFWLAIITGADVEYRIRYSLDIILVLLFLFLLCLPYLAAQVFIATVLLIYIAIVLFNKLLRKVPGE